MFAFVNNIMFIGGRQKIVRSVIRILNIAVSFLIVIFMLLAILLVGLRFAGLQIFTVLSGSMEPTFHVGSVIYVKKVDPATLQKGDAITFTLSEGTVVTHRIIELVQDENNPNITRFRTQGDANNTADGTLVEEDNIIGKAVFSIPYLGYVATYIQTESGRYAAICASAILIFMTIIIDLLSPKKGGKEDEAKE